MNGTHESIKTIVDRLNDAKLTDKTEVVIAPPFPYIAQAVSENKQPTVTVAGQNVYLKDNGAYTGEISASMLKDIGAKWVILGHSERRSLLKESSEFVAEKTKYAIDNGLGVILCVGETKEEREGGRTFAVVSAQLKAVIGAISKDAWKHIVVAYEPVWAIGTGLTATPDDAEATQKELREYLAKEASSEIAESTRIIYGGSVTGKTAPDLAKKPNIDGFLVGGASLKPEFVDIINVAAN